MDRIYEWIQNIVFYMLLVTMVFTLLPDKKYEKYLRLFTGAVLILLVFGPLSEAAGLEGRMAGAFEQRTLQNEVAFLKRDLAEAEGERMERLLEGYRTAVETDIAVMGDGVFAKCLGVSVALNPEAFKPEAGMEEAGKEGTGMEGTGGQGTGKKEDRAKRAGVIQAVDMTMGLSEGTKELPPEAVLKKRREANREIGDLKKKIGEYYGVEERNIVIRLEDE